VFKASWGGNTPTQTQMQHDQTRISLSQALCRAQTGEKDGETMGVMTVWSFAICERISGKMVWDQDQGSEGEFVLPVKTHPDIPLKRMRCGARESLIPA